jgi:hypothetical protein
MIGESKITTSALSTGGIGDTSILTLAIKSSMAVLSPRLFLGNWHSKGSGANL